LLHWSQDTLAGASGVSAATIKRLEARDGDLGGRDSTIERLRRALESAGIAFIGGEAAPGVQLRLPATLVATLQPDELNASNDE
jgi:hypothetical protein